uniref:Titin n=1 Tax=Rhodnius prolixus TaxID=13249 RepID=A0ABL0EK17_RHOPR
MTLECETSHTVSTTWFQDGKELSGMDNREIVQQGRIQKLVIKKASRKDKGTYKCMVKDQSTETKLIVHEVKPDFVRKLEDCEIKEQQCAVLEVEVTSDIADVLWQKDGLPLEPSPGKIEMEKQGPLRKLFIRSTSVHDEGEYTCVLGDQECTAEVTVIELPPEILTELQDTSVTRGERACLEVELTKGDALVRWFKDDVEIQFSEHIQLSIDGKRQKLKIYQAEESDVGIYSCRVGNQVSAARLTIEEPQVEFITRLPDVTMLPVGSDAEFTVELSRPDVEVKWFKKGKEIKASDRFMITSDGAKRKLVIKKVTLDDQSDISCMAMNVKTTTKLKIEVIETAPRINVDVKEYKVKRGEDATFTIKYTGTPKPTDEWTVNGTVIKKSNRIFTSVEEDSASLTIKKVEDSDRGSYCIKLKNNVGEASASLTLIIIEVPGAPSAPEIVDVTNTSVTVLWKEPSFDGNSPITSYVLEHHDKEEFLKWHEVIGITEKTYKVTGLERGHEITFRVTALNDVGRGKTSDSSKYVKVEEPGSSQAPSFKQPLIDISAGLDRSVTLSCVVSGLPIPEVKWFKDGKGLKTKKATYADSVAKLTIEKVIESSGGVYTCKASNSAGTAETTCKLVVQEAPALKIDDEISSQRLKISEQWKPVVEFTGFPRPEIVWLKDGKQIVSDKKVSIYTEENTTTLAIYSVDRKDSGTYTVSAVNSAGKTSLDVVLKVIDKPSKPKTISIKDIEAESVNVFWEPPSDDGGVDISKYSLEKCEVGKMIWTKVADIEREVRSYAVQRLITNAEYMFRIFAQNPVGLSEPVESDSVVIKSIYGKPSAPSGPIEISGMTETSCIISWEIPMSDGGTPIIDYNVEKRETDQTMWTKVGTTKDLQIIISDMEKEKSYEFRVSARNRVGPGPYLISDEPVVAGRKKTPPSPPKNISVLNIASKSVTLQWEPPLSNGGSELTGYVIEKQPTATSKWTKVVTLDPNVTYYSVENLKEKSEFYFRVFAENVIGLSFPTTSNLVSLKTHATVPSPPTAPLEVRSTGANSVMLAWGVPESDGGAPIEGYKIAVRDIKKTMWMEVGKVSAEVQKLTVKDLQENHEYLIRIFARNEVGMSNPLESDEPFKVQRPTAGGEDIDIEEMGVDKDTPSLSFTTTTTQSWMREAGMDPDIYTYSRSSLLRRSEYFFRIWYYAKHLFK